MTSPFGIERCLSFIHAQLMNGKLRNNLDAEGQIRAVTISRQTGCGAMAVAQKLADYLQTRTPEEEASWTVFDKNLVERVLEDHHLPHRLAKFMPENWSSLINDTLDELFGLHPPSWILVRQTAETILRLVTLGNVIIIGRGANVVTAKLNTVFHVRLVAPLERRIQRIVDSDQLDSKAAQEFIQREDRGRELYLDKYYNKDINDPLLYHFVINTDLIPCAKAAQIIGDIVMEHRPQRRLVHA